MTTTDAPSPGDILAVADALGGLLRDVRDHAAADLEVIDQAVACAKVLSLIADEAGTLAYIRLASGIVGAIDRAMAICTSRADALRDGHSLSRGLALALAGDGQALDDARILAAAIIRAHAKCMKKETP